MSQLPILSTIRRTPPSFYPFPFSQQPGKEATKPRLIKRLVQPHETKMCVIPETYYSCNHLSYSDPPLPCSNNVVPDECPNTQTIISATLSGICDSCQDILKERKEREEREEQERNEREEKCRNWLDKVEREGDTHKE